jgi:GNAT superfamily N-acetyltransferase
LSEVHIGWTESVAEREVRVDVISSAWRAAYGHIFSDAEISGLFDGRLDGQGSWVPARLAPAGTLAARRAGRLVGLASLGLLRGGDAELAALYVRPEEQGRGIGTALWSRALEEFRTAGCPRMEVWTLSRSDARGFYEARGCVPVKEGTFTVAAHVEAVVGYALDLRASPGSTSGESRPRR